MRTREQKAIEFGAAIVACLLTDSQLDFRNNVQYNGRLTKLLLPGESIREAAQRYFREIL